MRIPSGKRIPLPLNKADSPSEVSPVRLQEQLANVGLTCPDTTVANLEIFINDVRRDLQDSSLQTFMITTHRDAPVQQARMMRMSVQEVISETLVDHAQDLVEPLADAPPPVQSLFTILGSNDAEVRHYVEELAMDDPVAAHLVKQVNEPRVTARTAVVQMAEAVQGGTSFSRSARSMGSPAIEHLSYLAAKNMEPRGVGTWKVGTSTITTHFSDMLSSVQEVDNWRRVQRRYQAASRTFPGQEKQRNYEKQNLDNAEAIKKMFKNVANTAAETALSNINKTDAEAMLSKPLAAMEDSNLQDYSKTDDALLFLALNYSENDNSADAYGIMVIEWSISIEDYKRKSKQGGTTHPTTMGVKTRYISYGGCPGMSDLCEDYKYLTGKCAPICTTLKDLCVGQWPQSTPCSSG